MSGADIGSAKERHYAYLAARLDALGTTVQHTQHYMAIAGEQAAYIKDLGLGQGALFMAALHQVDHENSQNAQKD